MLQDARASASDPAVICSFDYEAIDKPTRAIIHQAARFLYVKRGRGKLVIDGEEYVLQPNTLVAITPWKITDTVEVTETLQFIKVIYDYSYLNSVFKSVLGSGDASAEPLRFLTVEPVAYLDSVQAEYVDGWLKLDNPADIQNLFQMTPYYYKTGREEHARLEQLESLSTQISFEILQYRAVAASAPADKPQGDAR